MAKYIYISLLVIFLCGGFLYYWNYDELYYKVCESPQKHENFKNLDIEKQFQTYIKYNCKYDSLSARSQWGTYIGRKGGAIDFLLNKLQTENDEDILAHTVRILRDTVTQHEIEGREDIVPIVNQTVEKIPEKDERDFVAKILGSEVWSRKKRLQKMAEEIEARTKISKVEYQEKVEKVVQEKIDNQIKEVIEQIKQKQANTK